MIGGQIPVQVVHILILTTDDNQNIGESDIDLTKRLEIVDPLIKDTISEAEEVLLDIVGNRRRNLVERRGVLSNVLGDAGISSVSLGTDDESTGAVDDLLVDAEVIITTPFHPGYLQSNAAAT